MLTRWPILLIGTLLLMACSDSNLDIPDRNSIGGSRPLIEIYAPDGDTPLPANTPFTLDYTILRSPNGHHVKIRVDDKKPQIVMRLSGKHQVQGLPAGKHRVRITEYKKDGEETGGDITLTVTMQATTPAP
jgi:hypothetical protein